MKRSLFLLVLVTGSLNIFAQDTKQEQRNAIDVLSWMVGNWTGKSEVVVEGENHTLTYITETVEPALNGTILIVNANGKEADSASGNLTTVYTSFSVISYDEKNKKYHWSTWRNPGNSYDSHDFKADSSSYEYITEEGGDQKRYTAKLDESGNWTSTGEYSKDGTAWGKFITMTLRK